jgi:uncharacterized membrane protein
LIQLCHCLSCSERHEWVKNVLCIWIYVAFLLCFLLQKLFFLLEILN